jgi:integrase
MEKTEKKRRAFSKQEARIVIKAIRKDSQLLFYGLLFEYCCFLRPSEIVKLTGGDIDIDQGIITIPSSKGKTKKTRYATIPNAFLDYFDKSFFKKIPRHAYIFGAGFIPAQSKPCNNNTMGKRHKRILERLKNEGILKDISGLQWYSWKDTGITDALENVAILAVQDQAGHHSPEMTLKYRHKKKINRALQDGFKNEII